MSKRPGHELPFLLLGAFDALVAELHAELSLRGHPHATPAHGFALQAIGPDGTTISELGRRLDVTKQAAAKTVATMEALGYVKREAADDARATMVRRAKKGEQLLARSAEIFGELRAKLARKLGPGRLSALEDDLARMAARRG